MYFFRVVIDAAGNSDYPQFRPKTQGVYHFMVKKEEPRIHVLIVAAGTGARLGGDTPKQYRCLAGQPILRHTLEKFIDLPGLMSVRVVIHPDHRAMYDAAVAGLNLLPPVIGGATRQDSVRNGLNAITESHDTDIVLIHDAARPFASAAEILSVIQAAHESGAATVSCPVADTLLRGRDIVDRADLHAIQTPQGFRFAMIRAAHEKFAKDQSFTDDTGMVRAMGHDVTLVPGNRMNFKITTEDDLAMASSLLSAQKQTRTGMGFDVHAFDPAPATAVRMGGIDIPHDRKLKGHSDADVVLHAVTDAILGTIAAGDIGSHFPPSDPRWKGADSAVFLQEAARLLAERGGELVHVDVTVMCEAPKIGPHRDAMRARIADILKMSADDVAVKATTTEGLGFTGRREGIAAHAMVTVCV
jgi:2-C-methyl-D-erythritol 4-phosphate cytidylyltransferase/2-C-methyl-D-erythritol 2,4-cyclodiphosphate synthase